MTAKLQKRVSQLKSTLNSKNLATVAYNYFKKVTPIDSGNARNKTSLSGTDINAAYPYAKRLDNGWSRQAPQGMVKPTIEYLRKYIKSQLGK